MNGPLCAKLFAIAGGLALAASSPVAQTNRLVAPPRRLVIPAPTVQANRVDVLKPGVHGARRYEIIALVPGPHPDDRMIICEGGQVDSGIPVLRPPLRFVLRDALFGQTTTNR